MKTHIGLSSDVHIVALLADAGFHHRLTIPLAGTAKESVWTTADSV